MEFYFQFCEISHNKLPINWQTIGNKNASTAISVASLEIASRIIKSLKSVRHLPANLKYKYNASRVPDISRYTMIAQTSRVFIFETYESLINTRDSIRRNSILHSTQNSFHWRNSFYVTWRKLSQIRQFRSMGWRKSILLVRQAVQQSLR